MLRAQDLHLQILVTVNSNPKICRKDFPQNVSGTVRNWRTLNDETDNIYIFDIMI